MEQTLIQKLNDLARHFAIEHKAREFNGPLTPARGRVLAPQWALFNRNRRDCWGRRGNHRLCPGAQRSGSCPPAVSHQRRNSTVLDELSNEPKLKTSKFEDFVDMRALHELEREGVFK